MKTAPISLPAHWLRSPVHQGIGPARARLLMLGAAGLVWLISVAGYGGVFAVLGLLVAGGWLIWQRPFVGVMTLIVGGALHQILMLLAFQVLGASLALRAVQSWKEAVVVLLLARALDQALRHRAAPRLQALDICLLGFLLLATLYLAYPSSVEEVTFTTALFGLRADVFFLLAYFIGRALPWSPRQVRLILVTLTLLAITNAIIGAWQIAAPGSANDFFASLGHREYVEAQRGDGSGIFAVRQNNVSGAAFTRASSIFLSDLGLAFFTLFAAPMVVARLFQSRRVLGRAALNVVALAAIGTIVMTGTRTAILAAGPALAMVTLLGRGYATVILLVVQLALVAFPLALRFDLTPSLVTDIFSPNEASARGHLSAYEQSIEVIRSEPFGRGLGTSGTVSQRFAGEGGITNESWYLQIATEIGIVAAGLFLLVTLLAIVGCIRAYLAAPPGEFRTLALGMTGAIVGLSLAAITLHAWDGMTTSITVWLLIGIVIQTHRRGPLTASEH